jgi:hypothetical protein
MGKKIHFIVVLVMFLLLFSIFTVAENWRNDGAAYRVKIHAQCGPSTPTLELCWDDNHLYQRTGETSFGITGQEWRNIKITDNGGLKKVGKDFNENNRPGSDWFASKKGAKEGDYGPAELRFRAPIDPDSREMNPEKHAILELAARDAAIDGWQDVIDGIGERNIVFQIGLGTEVTEFVTAWEAVDHPAVKQAIVRRIQKVAKSMDLDLSNQELNELANNAFNKIPRPSAGEGGAMFFSGTTKLASEFLAIGGIKTANGGKLMKILGVGVGKDVVHTTKKVAEGDYVGAAANIFATVTMTTLPLGMEKLAQTKLLEPLTRGLKGWAERVPTILANSPYVKQLAKGTGKKAVKTSVKYLFMGMVAAGEGEAIGLTKSDIIALGFQPTNEFLRFHQAPMGKWATIDSGKEGYVYMKAYDSEGVLRAFAKDKNEVIQRQVDFERWSVVKSSEPISLGSAKDQFDQAPVGEFLSIDAGVSGWTYAKLPKEEGSAELVLYRISSDMVLERLNEDGTWSSLNAQERISYTSVIRSATVAKEERIKVEALAKSVEETLKAAGEVLAAIPVIGTKYSAGDAYVKVLKVNDDGSISANYCPTSDPYGCISYTFMTVEAMDQFVNQKGLYRRYIPEAPKEEEKVEEEPDEEDEEFSLFDEGQCDPGDSSQECPEEELPPEDDSSSLFDEGQCNPDDPSPECIWEISSGDDDQSVPICGEG